MALVRAVCTACGSNLEVDDKKEAAICPYCGAAYVVEKARDIYLTNNAKIESIHADTVNIGKNEEDRLYDSAEALIKLGKSIEALSTFQKMTNSYPYDYRGWWGLAKAESNGLNTMIPAESMVSVLEHMESAIKVAPSDIIESLKSTANEYREACIKELDSRTIELKSLKDQYDNKSKTIKHSRIFRNISIPMYILAIPTFIAGVVLTALNLDIYKVFFILLLALVIVATVLLTISSILKSHDENDKEIINNKIQSLMRIQNIQDNISDIVI